VQRRKAWDEDIEDELESTNLNVETLLKMSSASKSVSKKRDKSPPIQKRDKSPSEIKLTPQQIKLVENYIQGKQKIINDLELYFIKNLPAVCGMIIATLSVQAETKIRQHRQFDRAYGSDDVIRLMRIIQKCAVLTPLDVPNLANQLRKSRDKLYQGNKTLDYFCELFNQFEKDLIELERPTPEEDLIVTFLDHLHPSYCTIITQWRMNGIMPTAIDAVQYKLQQYESLAISQSSIMKVSHGKQSDAGVQDVAMIAQAAKGHQGSNKKGSASNKGNQQQQQSSGNNNNKPKREPMTEERAKALGLKKLPCCGKYGTHDPADCRNPTKSSGSQVNAATATTESKQSKSRHTKKEETDHAAAVATRASFYEDDIIVLMVTDTTLQPSHTILPVAYRRNVVVVYLDTGASTNAVPIDSPIVLNIHDIPSRDVIGIGQEACKQAGFLPHFGPALLLPSLSMHLISLSAQRQRDMSIRYDQEGDFFHLRRGGDDEYQFTL
jgi:hypothetical protein